MDSSDESKRFLRIVHSGDFEWFTGYLQNNKIDHWVDFRYPGNGETALHVAARLGHTKMMRYLLDNYTPKFVDVKNCDDKTPLHEAAQFGKYEAAKILVENEANVNALKRGDWTPLMLASANSQSEAFISLIELLIKNEALLDVINKDGWTALHLAVRRGCLKTVNILIESGATVNISTSNARTVLHVAALHSRIRIFQRLVEYMPVDCVDQGGNSPIHDAVLGKNVEMFKVVLKYHSDISVRNKADNTILHLAATVGALDIIIYLIRELKMDVNISNRMQLRPLHYAAIEKNWDAILLLLRLGADESLVDIHNRTAKDYYDYTPFLVQMKGIRYL